MPNEREAAAAILRREAAMGGENFAQEGKKEERKKKLPESRKKTLGNVYRLIRYELQLVPEWWQTDMNIKPRHSDGKPGREAWERRGWWGDDGGQGWWLVGG